MEPQWWKGAWRLYIWCAASVPMRGVCVASVSWKCGAGGAGRKSDKAVRHPILILTNDAEPDYRTRKSDTDCGASILRHPIRDEYA